MSQTDIVDTYQQVGLYGGGVCTVVEGVCSLAQDSDYNFAGQFQGELTPQQLAKNLKLDAVILVFAIIRISLTVPLKSERRPEADPFRLGAWGTNALTTVRHGISVFAPAQSQAQVNKVLGGVAIAECLARLVLQIIVSGHQLDTSDIQDSKHKSMVNSVEILDLFSNILSFIGGACAGASMLNPEPETKGILKVIGGAGKLFSGVLMGVQGAVIGLDMAVDFVREQ